MDYHISVIVNVQYLLKNSQQFLKLMMCVYFTDINDW